MSKAHEVFLQEMMRIPGVKSAMLVNNRGEVLLSTGQFTLNSQATIQMGTIITQSVSVAEGVYGKTDEISILYGEGRITTITNLDLLIESSYGVQEVFVIIVSAPNANLPTIRLTVKVAASKLKLDKAIRDLKVSVRVDRRNLLSRDRLDATSWELFEAMNRA
ncbi:MAG TPA: roadblock/LC7 domain-containing protein [Acidobacteriota bacterium]|nr:roadblock/LC7 domain-containing protein [Acidobacteriota bacterium]HMV98951.1 roadblock/LC7 domain-containing protein [Acidobacteriota bacterium]HMZ82473.1 roadblock/LC7 domain-containing protein [Acidobacteriota bacterium]HNB71511.1 roadblock/LC7 domain-containing protein [Acidobacteriota bacterium]HNC46785.1 roadblock/LC7 domain-containing protein [Acidobacteriota bacterium]